MLGDQTGIPFLRVVASDTGEPVPGVIVEMTLIGPDGGDGGYQVYLTNADGYARLYVPLHQGRYQFGLVPSPDSRFCETQWHRDDPYLTILNGLCQPGQVQLQANMK